MISDDRLSKALKYLAETDMEAAEKKADVERKEWLFKRYKALHFKLSEGTVADRTAKADTNEEVAFAAEQWFIAIRDSEAIRAKRQTEALIVEVWRTVSANQRRGNV